MKQYTTPKVVITALSRGDIVALSLGKNELPWQPVGGSCENGLETL